ncbi:ABC transporter substrate-binding protein [Actinomyces marmotae]|uniref:ABC transporter substrate-binding protein n=1 Tax=Actinomyces marmotae TaxID=2737173 RepID=A0A6M8AYX8_9ACTO|nr:ABC transporter substrate-binding protein [Actinomyces marmotae]QKD79739.1 ABC transporter substrate-binding protein [Actinomyces marmotae]
MTRQSSRPRLTRRGLIASALALTGGGALAACSSGTASQALRPGGAATGGPLTIGLTYTPNIQFAPFYMALANKDYEPAIKLRHHGGSEGLFDALLAGTEQMVIAGADEAVVAASNGSPLVVIGGYYQRHPGCVIAREDSAVASLADLKGRVVGLPGRTGENWYALQVAMRSAGLSESDLTILEIGFTQQAALAQPKPSAGDASRPDAIIGFSNNDAVGLKEAGVAVRTIPIGDDVPLIGASLVTTRAVLEARRAELADAVMASSRGMAAFVADPDAAVAATRQYVPDLVDDAQAAQARAVAVATAELIAPQGSDTTIGALERAKAATMIEFLGAQGILGPTEVTADAVCQPLLAA